MSAKQESSKNPLLPNSGYLKLRAEYATNAGVTVKLYHPKKRRNVKVGSIDAENNEWRWFSTVVFCDRGRRGNYHEIRVDLTVHEREKIQQTYHWTVRYGFVTFEDRSKANITSSKSAVDWSALPGRFMFYTKPVVLISLFDGIGGARVALDGLCHQKNHNDNHSDNISSPLYRIVRSFSSEKMESAKAVAQQYAPDTVELGDIRNISRTMLHRRVLQDDTVAHYIKHRHWADELHFVVIAGPPCQDLSQAKARASADGIADGVVKGAQSNLFFHVPRILSYLYDADALPNASIHYIVENVNMSITDRKVFDFFLGNRIPVEIDFNRGGACSSLMSRPRLYWCSFPMHSYCIGVGDFIAASRYFMCIHPAKLRNLSLNDVLQHHAPGYEFINRFTNEEVNVLGTLTRRNSQVGQEVYWIRKKQGSAIDGPFEQESPQSLNEDLLGFPIGYTGGESRNEAQRRLLLGNSFMIFHVRYLLWHLGNRILIRGRQLDQSFRIRQPQMVCREKMNDQTTVDSRVSELLHDIKKLLSNQGFDELDLEEKGTLFYHFLRRVDGVEKRQRIDG